MIISRRSVLSGAAILGAATLTSVTGCSTSKNRGGHGAELPLWYWGGGLSDAVVKDSIAEFASSVRVSPQKIEGNFKQKLTAALAAGHGLPGVTGLKGEDIALFKASADKFVDLNTLGASDMAKDFLPWKWKQATTAGGAQIGIPIDIGPTAFFYRGDLFEKAGLPRDPLTMSEQLTTWDEFVTVARTVQTATGAFLISSVTDLFPILLGQGEHRFIAEDGSFVGDSPVIRRSWDLCVRLLQENLVARTGKSYQTALQNGRLAGDLGAAWHALDIKDHVKEQAGKWQVSAHPGKPTNFGGSFLGIPKGAADPKKSMELIQWLLKPENGAKGFADASILPATPSSFTLPELTAPDAYFSGQKTIDVFGKAAQEVHLQYEAAADAAVGEPFFTELGTVETGGKDPEKAWQDAVEQSRKITRRHTGQ